MAKSTKVKNDTKQSHSISVEKLVHFQCSSCKKWWSIGDAPMAKKNWFCPWCGTESTVKKLP